jgi:hypothetical protein
MSTVSARSVMIVFGLVSGTSSLAIAHDDGHGKDWRPFTQTTGIGWELAATVCPQDGQTPCSGSIASRNLSEWVWGTRDQALALLGQYAPDILSSANASVFGSQYTLAAGNFFAAFGITQRVVTLGGYFNAGSDFTFSGGVTSSKNPAGLPVGGAASISDGVGGFGLAAVSAFESPATRGLFLWRPTGLEDGSIHAYDDEGRSTAPEGGAVVNVLTNDYIAGARATISNVSVSLVSAASHSGVTLNTSNGSVDVAAGTPVGAYSLVYRICDLVNASICDDATVTVTVPSFTIVAVNDQGYAAYGSGGTTVANVLANDTLGFSRATTALVSLSQVSSSSPGISLNADGSVSVAPGTASGLHSLVYRICEISNPANCAQATASLKPNVIDAVDDYVRAVSKTTAVVLPSVLSNDTFSGVRATTDKVSLSQVSLTPSGYGFAFNLSTGAVSVTAKTSSGIYALVYKICEIGNPANCDQATATVELSGKTR